MEPITTKTPPPRSISAKAWRRAVGQMLLLAVAGVLVGLGVNALRREPLPLFRAPAKAAADARFTEIDDRLLRQLVETGRAALLDARLPPLFKAGHIPGARSLPVADFEAAYRSWQAEAAPDLRPGGATMLIVYCSDVDCADARTLGGMLFAKGHRDILIYPGGWREWEQKGHEMER